MLNFYNVVAVVKRLNFCNGVQRYNVFLNWKNFFCLFSKKSSQNQLTRALVD